MLMAESLISSSVSESGRFSVRQKSDGAVPVFPGQEPARFPGFAAGVAGSIILILFSYCRKCCQSGQNFVL
jgi:hypothetical protein